MIQINGWLVIIPTYLDEDLHSEIDEKAIYSQVDNIISNLKYNEIPVTIVRMVKKRV